MASACGSETNTLVDRQSVWDPEEKSLVDTSSVYSHSKSVALTKEKTFRYYEDSQRPRGGISHVLRSIVKFPSRAMRTATTLAYSLLAQSNADMQVRGAVLAHAAVINKRYGGEKRPSQAVNDPLAIVPVSRKVVQARASAVKQRLDAQTQSAPTSTYLDLLDLICIVLRVPPGSYSEPLVRRIWNMLICELQRGRSSDFVAALSQPQCTEEDVGTVLRHVALSHLGGWKPLPPPQLGLYCAESYMKSVAFSRDTYNNYLVLEKAFFEVLCGLLDRRPEAVHAALDDYMHLVWFKFASNTANTTTNFAYVLDNLSYTYHSYWKRFDPCPSGEVESLILYLATAPISPPRNAGESSYIDGKGISHLSRAIQHVCTSLSTIATASLPRISASSSLSTFPSPNWNIPEIFQLAREHPGLFGGDLVHPALPIILFVAQLAQHSPHSIALLTSDPHGFLGSSSFMDSLARLWQYSFLLPCDCKYTAPAYSGPASVPGPGSGVSREKREYAMRLATCYLLATMSASAHRAEQLDDPAPMDSLVQRLLSSPRLEAWLWDVASTALTLRVTSRKERNRTRTEWPLSEGKGVERDSWGIYEDTLPDILHVVRRVIQAKPPSPFKPTGEPQDVEKLVWMLEVETTNLSLPILTSVLTSTTSSKAWIGALDIFDGCHDLNAPHLVSSICQFAQLLLQDAPAHSLRKSIQSSSSTPPSANPTASPKKREKRTSPGLRTSTSLEPLLFVPHTTDRFLMLILSAARRNEALRAGIGRSAETKRVLADLVHAVEGGAFDGGMKLDTQQREWRARACRDVSTTFL